MYALFDIGGTKTRVAFSEDGEVFEKPVILETPQEFEKGVAMIAETVRSISNGREMHAAVGGVAGPLDSACAAVARAPHLPDWAGKPLQQTLSQALGHEVFLQNDTALVGLGEALHGAGRGSTIVAYITVSTGVGGARIIDGKIDRNRFGFEPGHQIIDVDNTACRDCKFGDVGDVLLDLGNMISGAATERRFKKKPYEIAQSEPLWDELAHWLAAGLANTIVHWSPDVVVLGGSMMIGDPRILLADVKRHLRDALKIFPEHPALVLAELGAVGGLHGALLYAKEVMNAPLK